MNKSIAFFLFLALFTCSLSVLAISPAINRSAERVSNGLVEGMTAESPMDQIIRSREMVAHARTDMGWAAFGLFILIIFVLVSAWLTMYLGTPFVKQVMQLRRQPSAPAPNYPLHVLKTVPTITTHAAPLGQPGTGSGEKVSWLQSKDSYQV